MVNNGAGGSGERGAEVRECAMRSEERGRDGEQEGSGKRGEGRGGGGGGREWHKFFYHVISSCRHPPESAEAEPENKEED